MYVSIFWIMPIIVNYISAALPRPAIHGPAIYDTSTPGGDFGARKLAGLVLRIPARNKKGKEGAG